MRSKKLDVRRKRIENETATENKTETEIEVAVEKENDRIDEVRIEIGRDKFGRTGLDELMK